MRIVSRFFLKQSRIEHKRVLDKIFVNRFVSEIKFYNFTDLYLFCITIK
jgi:hypothetical protein